MQQAIPARPALGGHKALIGALILGAIAAGLIVAFLASRGSDDSTSVVSARVSVVVAAEDIPAGTKITSSQVDARQLPRELLVEPAPIVRVGERDLRVHLAAYEQLHE